MISNWPPDMRSMSLEKRTPEGPRCGSELAKALCIFHWIFFCCARDTVDTAAKASATAAAPHCDGRIILPSSSRLARAS